MKVTDFTKSTFENIKSTLDFNGYAWFSKDVYLKKGTEPCFIPENGEDLDDVFSWEDLYKETLETIKTKDFILAVAENYSKDNLITHIENADEDQLDYDKSYLEITNETPEKFAEGIMDSYFLSDEVWCYLSTKLADYTMST